MTTRWYHGGQPGLKAGKRILCPRDSGVLTATQMVRDAGLDEGLEADRCREDRVYLTVHLELARAYAFNWASTRKMAERARYGGNLLSTHRLVGAVYQAAAGPGAEPDPDFEELFPGQFIQAPYASVLSVTERRVSISQAQALLVMVKYKSWEPGPCPECGHETEDPDPACRCVPGCICPAFAIDPTVLQRVYPPKTARR